MLTDFFSLIHIIAVASITAVCLWILIRQRRIRRRLETSAGAGEDLRLRRQSRRVLMVGLTALAVVMASRIIPLLVGSGQMESRHPGASVDEVPALPPAGAQGRQIRIKIAPPPETPREAPAKPQPGPQPAEKPVDPVSETSPPEPAEPAATSPVKPTESVAEAVPTKTAEPAGQAPPPKKAKPVAEASLPKIPAAPSARKGPEPQNTPAAASKEEKSVHPYTVHVSSHRDRNEALQAALQFAADGDPAFTSPARIPGKGDWHRVFIGFYRDRQEALSAAERLKKRKYPYVMVLRQPYAVQVGLLEPEEDLDRAGSHLEQEGLVSYPIPESDSRKVRLLVGSFGTAEEAGSLKSRLDKAGIPSRVVFR